MATLTLPLSASELCAAVRHAQPFDAARLDRVLRVDASRGFAETQSSTTWSSLAAHLHPGDAAMRAAWAGYGTVAEGVAENVAGPDGRPVVAHVECIALVTADGELRRVGRGSDLFALAAGGHGLFGSPYSVTLRLESFARAAIDVAPPAALALPCAEGAARPAHFLVPPESCDPFLAEARARCAEWRVAIQAAQARRTLPEEETLLRWARREYAAVTLQLAELPTLGGAVRATQLRRQLIDLAIAHGGSFPIARTPEATRAQVEACYPELRRLFAEKRRLDPAERLSNSWYRHHRSLLGREECEVRWAR